MKLFSKKLLFSLAITILLFSHIRIAFAQESEDDAPVYIVEPGDTLYSIAFRFGVTVDDLVSANQLADINQLFVGDRLVIPGLEGVSGVLTTQELGFGENMRSLSRQYQIAPAQLQKLNRLVSPAELVVGASLVIPVPEGAATELQRATLAPGESLLALAASSRVNPWDIALRNNLVGASLALPGDILFLAGSGSESGPGGFPGVITEVEVSDLYQGETGVVWISSAEEVNLNGRIAGYPLRFFNAGQGGYVALQGVDALHEPGMYPMNLAGETASGMQFEFEQWVYISPRDYIFEYINVPPELIDPETTAKETAMVKEIIAPITTEKYWSGEFKAPSPFADCINSSFGNRRSYNGSAFSYYHGGIDFCGGTGVEIYAPAPGKVVFAGPMEVRGNYTIIDHGWQVYSGYMHQSEIYVEVGDVVQTGQTIGLVGNTGRSTGPHLHWEIYVGGELVNPWDWLVNSYP